MELLGEDLQQLTLRSRKMSVKTVLMVGLQAIDRIQVLHKIGFLHRDIKPDNLVIGLNEKSKVIYLIDFGLTKGVDEQQSPDQVNKAIGTLGYMSVRAHQGKLLGRADDLESLMYTLLYLMLGTLPWMKLKLKDVRDYHRIKIMKEKLNKELPHSANLRIPQQVIHVFNYVRSLKRPDLPDYLKIKYKFIEALKNINQENDFAFDWCIKDFRKLAKIPDSSKQLIEMKEHNQRFVEGQIYQVYKFIKDQQSYGINIIKPKNNKNTPEKPHIYQQKLLPDQRAITKKQNRERKGEELFSKQKVEQQKSLLQQDFKKYCLKLEAQFPGRPNSTLKAAERPQIQRPASTRKPKNKNWENPWKDQMAKVTEMNFQGPRIVINKTAKHKI